jgi:hypothetical protein
MCDRINHIIIRNENICENQHRMDAHINMKDPRRYELFKRHNGFYGNRELDKKEIECAHCRSFIYKLANK